jgi:mono/diheme cytochrome c family protein
MVVVSCAGDGWGTLASMAGQPRTRRANREAREAAARRARWLWAGAGLVVVGVVVVLFLTSGSDDQPLEAGSEAQLAHGEQVFQSNCSTCHGDELQGTFVGPSLLDEIYAPDHHGDEAFRAAVARGVQPHHWDFAAMPPIPGLSDEDVEAVISYVRSVQRANGIGANEP